MRGGGGLRRCWVNKRVQKGWREVLEVGRKRRGARDEWCRRLEGGVEVLGEMVGWWLAKEKDDGVDKGRGKKRV